MVKDWRNRLWNQSLVLLQNKTLKQPNETDQFSVNPYWQLNCPINQVGKKRDEVQYSACIIHVNCYIFLTWIITCDESRISARGFLNEKQAKYFFSVKHFCINKMTLDRVVLKEPFEPSLDPPTIGDIHVQTANSGDWGTRSAVQNQYLLYNIGKLQNS